MFLSKTECLSVHGRIICVYEHGDLERSLHFGAWCLLGVLRKHFSHWVFMMLFRLICVLHLPRLLEEKNGFVGCVQNGQMFWLYKCTSAFVYGWEPQRTCLRWRTWRSLYAVCRQVLAAGSPDLYFRMGLDWVYFWVPGWIRIIDSISPSCLPFTTKNLCFLAASTSAHA